MKEAEYTENTKRQGKKRGIVFPSAEICVNLRIKKKRTTDEHGWTRMKKKEELSTESTEKHGKKRGIVPYLRKSA